MKHRQLDTGVLSILIYLRGIIPDVTKQAGLKKPWIVNLVIDCKPKMIHKFNRTLGDNPYPMGGKKTPPEPCTPVHTWPLVRKVSWLTSCITLITP